MKIFNSMNQKVEEFKPLHENEVHMYVCGPTVYNYPHIGNARPIVVFDTLKRTFQAMTVYPCTLQCRMRLQGLQKLWMPLLLLLSCWWIRDMHMK